MSNSFIHSAKAGPPSAVGSESDCESMAAGSSPGPAAYFHGDLSWNNFYVYSSLPVIQEGQFVSFWRKCVH